MPSRVARWEGPRPAASETTRIRPVSTHLGRNVRGTATWNDSLVRGRIVSGAGATTVVVSMVALIVAAIGDLPALLSRTGQSDVTQLLVFTAIGLVFAATGAFIVWRTGNLVGWVLLGTGISLGVMWLGVTALARHLDGATPGLLDGIVAGWLGWSWVPAIFLLTVFLPLLFPTGHPPGPGWRWVAVVGTVGVVVGFGGVGMEVASLPPESVLADDSWVWWVVMPTFYIGTLGAVASAVFRYRRAEVVERQQLKLVALASSVVVGVLLLSLTPLGAIALGDNNATQTLLPVVFLVIPLSMVVAISRYRLYEIDRIISRTVTYTLVVGMLALVYVGATLASSALAPTQDSLAVAVATLAAAALFNPLRRRVRAVVDRRFNRVAFDEVWALQTTRTRISDLTDSDTIGQVVLQVINETLQPSASAIWTRR